MASMKVEDLGKTGKGVKGFTPYNELTEESKSKQLNNPFPKPGEYDDKPKGFQNADLRMRSPVEKGFYAKDKLKELSQGFAEMTSFGRYHE